MTINKFVETIAPFVMLESTLSHILPSVTLAQAIIESRHGESGLTKKANNLFGIKGAYKGQSVTMMTTEYIGGHYVKVPAHFRKYPNWWESISDHSYLLISAKRYANIPGCDNYITACQNLQSDGYATAPDYASTLISYIQRYKLDDYDKKRFELYGKL